MSTPLFTTPHPDTGRPVCTICGGDLEHECFCTEREEPGFADLYRHYNAVTHDLRMVKAILDQVDEFGHVMPQESGLPPVAERLHELLSSLSWLHRAVNRSRDYGSLITTLHTEANAKDDENMRRIEAGFSGDEADGANRGFAAGLRRAAAILTTEMVTEDRRAGRAAREDG